MVKKKEIKKRELEKKKALREGLEYDNPTKGIFSTIIVVTLVFFSFYFITNLIVKNMNKFNYIDSTVTVTIQYDEILAGSTFNMNDEEYYVLFYDFDGEYATYYNSLIGSSSEKIYKVNLGNGFNKPYVSENTNSKVNNISDLRVKDCTLIKIKNGKNILYFEGQYEEIKDKLK